MRLPLTLLALASLAVAAPAGAQASPSVEPQVLALVSAFSDARAHFDAGALDALLTPIT